MAKVESRVVLLTAEVFCRAFFTLWDTGRDLRVARGGEAAIRAVSSHLRSVGDIPPRNGPGYHLVSCFTYS